ncbi:hypothetical protein C8R46DRAFT_551220 [Mycena filopes]|nr:hypothetical protein C8R46DRAFT_551220 [Mycena filopes]
MERRTRTGKTFSPFDFEDLQTDELTGRNFKIIQADVDLEEMIAAAADHDGESDSEVDFESSPPSPHPQPPFPLEPTASSSTTPSPIPSPPNPSSSPTASSDTSASGRAARDKARRKECRQRKRQELAPSPYARIPHAKSMPTHRLLPAEKTTFDAEEFETTSGGHWLGERRTKVEIPNAKPSKKSGEKGRKAPTKPRHLRELQELLDEGYRCIYWDGKHPLFILDRHGRIIAVFAGTPDDPEWPGVVSRAVAAMERARKDGFRLGAFDAADDTHRRGFFTTLTGGVSHGGGQLRPGNLAMPKIRRQIFDELRGNKDVQRMAGFQSSVFRTFAPKMFVDYVDHLQPLFHQNPTLQHNFNNSVFPTVTFNLGPQSVTFDHADEQNNPLGWCNITNGGDFNYHTSAHIYLKQVKLVVEFPPASTCAIPSAVVEHGNTPLAPNETRYAMTQYAAGGLFRYMEYGFKTAKELLKKKDGVALKAKADGLPGERLAKGLNLFSKVDELANDYSTRFGRGRTNS